MAGWDLPHGIGMREYHLSASCSFSSLWKSPNGCSMLEGSCNPMKSLNVLSRPYFLQVGVWGRGSPGKRQIKILSTTWLLHSGGVVCGAMIWPASWNMG